MAERATYTKLVWGGVKMPVALYKTVGKPEDVPEFETAGPNGGVLRLETVAAEKKPEPVPDRSDPLAEGMELADTPPPSSSLDDGGPLPEPVEGEFAQKLREEGTGIWVEKEDVRKGVRTGDGFVDLTEQLATIDEITKLDRMEIHGFFDVGRVDRKRIVGSYYLGSGGEGAPKFLRLLFEAMKSERRVAVVKWTKRSRQSEGVIVADGLTQALVVLEVAWAEMAREPHPRALSHLAAEFSLREVEAASALVRAMSDRVSSLDELEDDAVRLRRDLREDALDGKVSAVTVPPAAEEAEDLADALERSVASVGG